jgi:predicted nucleic acid-binding protein
LAQRARFPGGEINYTRGKFFVDTNVLVYAYDSSAGKKWKAASEILSLLWTNRTGIISTQVLQELYVALTHKVSHPILPEVGKEIISDFLRWPVVVNNAKSIVRAIDLQGKYHFSFWDSLILQAAMSAESDFLLTEDFQDGQSIESITVVNPFLR